jgi:hypothetical protein
MEQLLILNHPKPAEIRQTIENTAKVVQEGSQNLLVVEGSPEAIHEAAQLPGVKTADSLGAAAAEKLSPGERVFLEAWRQRRDTAGTKNRIGEGLSWGAKGFKAP